LGLVRLTPSIRVSYTASLFGTGRSRRAQFGEAFQQSWELPDGTASDEWPDASVFVPPAGFEKTQHGASVGPGKSSCTGKVPQVPPCGVTN
jgi:hypothetical protein